MSLSPSWAVANAAKGREAMYIQPLISACIAHNGIEVKYRALYNLIWDQLKPQSMCPKMIGTSSRIRKSHCSEKLR